MQGREEAGEERRGSKDCNLAMILLKAAADGNTAKVKKLLNNRAPADWQELERGRTALWAAAANGHREVAALLQAKGASVDKNVVVNGSGG